MALTQLIKDNDWISVRQAIAKLKTQVVSMGGTPLTASRLIATDASEELVSVTDLTSWIAGTSNEISVADDGDGTVTIGIVDPLIVGKGGTGAATLTDGGILLGSGTGAITALAQATNGQLPIGSTGTDPVLATLTGTTNQVTITNGAGTITLSLPQNIHTGASPTFVGLTLSGITNTQLIYSNSGVLAGDATLVFNNSTKLVTASGLVLNGTQTYGIDLSGGTWSSGVMNWDTNPDVYAAGTKIIGFDDTNYNLLIGISAFATNNGKYNVALGYQAGYYNTHTTADEGYYNTYIGYRAGYGNVAGSKGQRNFALGRSALQAIRNGYSNVAIGDIALGLCLDGTGNMAIGQAALYNAATPIGSISIGNDSTRFSTTTNYSVAIGTAAAYGTASNTFDYSVAIGGRSLFSITNSTNNTAIGYQSGYTTSSGDNNLFVGYQSGYYNTTGGNNVFLGHRSGMRQTVTSNLLIIDNQDRTSAALELTNSLIYGVFNAAVASQSLRINAATFTLNGGVDTDITCNFIGTTNSGLLNWMEDEDYFKFDDDILMNSTEKINFLDTAIGIYSQADTYLDIFADGGVRIGDSSAGAPTNYSKFESDGTLVFNGSATVFNDANVGAMMLALPAASQPDEVQFKDEAGADTGIYTWGFAIGEKVSGAIEIPHDYKEGTDLTFHIHWQGIAAPADGTDNVKWQLTYTVSSDEATLDAVTAIVIETAFDTQYEFKRSNFSAITGTNFDIGDQFLFTLERIAASADDYAGDALVATVGFHYECDTCGSRTITTK